METETGNGPRPTDSTYPAAGQELPKPPAELTAAERRARLVLWIAGIVAIVTLISLIVLLVWLSIGAYQAAYEGEPPSPGSVVVALLRDAAIVFVAFETLIIGLLLIILMIQVQSLIVLLRNEVGPMLESINETLATVRGTTQFVSHNVVSPVVKWSGYLAGLRRIFQQIGLLRDTVEKREVKHSSLEEETYE